MAAEQGIMPQVFKEEAASVLESGYAYRIPELRLKKRQSLGLPPLPKGNSESIRKTLRDLSLIKCVEKKSD
jgi:hypothetical protein